MREIVKTQLPYEIAPLASNLPALEHAITRCVACPRLREYCQTVAQTKIKRFAQDTYWGKPAPGFGDSRAATLIVGLAPAAHGANRTGRLFTGDRSGDVLYAGLHRAGFGSQAAAVSKDDGLVLTGVYISAAARCAPPENRPTPAELAACRAFLRREIELLEQMQVVLALGAVAHQAAWLALTASEAPRMPKFGHGSEQTVVFTGPLGRKAVTLLDCYHVSQRNTFTGLLTTAMLDEVLKRARQLSGGPAMGS